MGIRWWASEGRRPESRSSPCWPPWSCASWDSPFRWLGKRNRKYQHGGGPNLRRVKYHQIPGVATPIIVTKPGQNVPIQTTGISNIQVAHQRDLVPRESRGGSLHQLPSSI